jgi:hypothetical protein
MISLGKKVGTINLEYWGSRTEAEFINHFKAYALIDDLKAAYKELPKPKKAKVKKKTVEDGGPVLDSGEDK